MKSQSNSKNPDIYFSFVLVTVTIILLFYNIFIFMPLNIRMLVDFLLFIILLIPYWKKIFNLKRILFLSFYLFVTFVFLLLFFNDNHYGFTKLFSNSIVTFFYMIFYYFLYIRCSGYIMTKSLKRIVGFFLFVNYVLFVMFILYINGLLGNSLLLFFLLHDWSGRFRGIFSEPSTLGYFLGCMVFLIILIYKNWFKYLVAAFCIFILYYACQAKLAVLALPFALVLAALFTKEIAIKNIYPILFFFLTILCICFIIIDIILNFVYSSIIPNMAKDYLNTGTFVTRFCFLLGSIENLGKYPLGSGFGMNYEVFRDNIIKIISLGNRYRLNTVEIANYLKDSNNFGSKETFSVFLSSFGFVGFFIYIKHFVYLYNFKYYRNYICKALLWFIFIETLISISIILPLGVGILPLIYTRMILNEYKR